MGKFIVVGTVAGTVDVPVEEHNSAWHSLLTEEQRAAALDRVAQSRQRKAEDPLIFDRYARTLYNTLTQETISGDSGEAEAG